MQRQTVTSKKKKKKVRGKKTKKRSTTLRNTPCTLSVFPVLCHATNHENSEVNTVNKGTEWMK